MAEQDAVPVKGVIPTAELFGDDEQDTQLLREMAEKAQKYLASFPWCQSIRSSYFGDGVGGVVAVFLFHIEPSRAEVDEWLWVVVGDIPSAFLVLDNSPLPSLALEGYIQEMSKWVKLAKLGKSSHKVIPVNVPATPENALFLEGRLNTLKEFILPGFRYMETNRA